MTIHFSESRDLDPRKVLALYKANQWLSAEKPTELLNALKHSFDLITAWDGDTLVGLGNAISDGYLVVYYPHLLVLPEYQHQGIGTQIMRHMIEKYARFHQQVLVADNQAIDFYTKCGFIKSHTCHAMWIYKAKD
jgi:GNAT superfamily N-acetyltransferase